MCRNLKVHGKDIVFQNVHNLFTKLLNLKIRKLHIIGFSFVTKNYCRHFMAQLMVTSQLILPTNKLRSVKWIFLQNKILLGVGLGQLNWDSYQGRLRTTSILVRAFRNVIHTLGPGCQMMDPFGLWWTIVYEIQNLSSFLRGGLNGGVKSGQILV